MQAEQITHSSGTQISMVDIRSNGIVFSLIIKQRLSSPLFATPAPNSSSKASGEDYSLVGVYLHKYHFFPEDCTRRLKSNDSTVSSFSQEISITPGRSRTYLKDCFWLTGKTIEIVTQQCPYPWKQWMCRLKGTSEIRGLQRCTSTVPPFRLLLNRHLCNIYSTFRKLGIPPCSLLDLSTFH